jgi:hypothetical protein
MSQTKKNKSHKSTKKHKEKIKKARGVPQESRDRLFKRVSEKYKNINNYTYDFTSHEQSELDKKPTVELLATHKFEATVVPNTCKDCILVLLRSLNVNKSYKKQVWSTKNIFQPRFVRELTGNWAVCHDAPVDSPIVVNYIDGRVYNLETDAWYMSSPLPDTETWIYFDSNHMFYTDCGIGMYDLTTGAFDIKKSSIAEYMYGGFPTTARGGCIALFMFGYMYLVHFDQHGKLNHNYECLHDIEVSYGCCLDGDKVLCVDHQAVKIYNLENAELVKHIDYGDWVKNYKRFYQIGNNAFVATEKFLNGGYSFERTEENINQHKIYSTTTRQFVDIRIPGRIIHIDEDIIIALEENMTRLSFYQLLNLKRTRKIYNVYQYVYTNTYTDVGINCT